MRYASKKKQPPSREKLIEALSDIWVFADVINFHGGSSAFGAFHKELTKSYFTHNKRVRIVSRGHLKTTLSILEDLHRIYVNPNIRIFIGTGRKELGQSIMREIQQYLLDPFLQEHVWNNRPHYPGIRLIPVMERGAGTTARKQSYNRLYVLEENDLLDELPESSDRKIVWNRDQIQVLRDVISKDPTVGVGCAGSASTGFHFDVLHFDDIIDFNNYDNEQKKERIDIWKNDGFSVLDPEYFDTDLFELLKGLSKKKQYQDRMRFMCHVGESVVVNGTRYFPWDWYKELKILCGIEDEHSVPCEGFDEDSGWIYQERNIYNNGVDALAGYSWTERWNEGVERAKKSTMSSKHWTRQYLNRVVVDEELVFNFDKIKFYSQEDSLIKEANTNYWLFKQVDGEIHRVFPRVCIDPAMTASKSSDYTAIVVGGMTADRRLIVFDLYYGKWMAQDWAKKVVDLCEKWNTWLTHLESVVFSFTLADVIKQEVLTRSHRGVVVREFRPPKDKSKQERIESGLQPLIENGGLYFPYYLFKDRSLRDMFSFFPSDNVADDPLDVIEMLRECAKPVGKGSKIATPVHTVNKLHGGLY